MNDLDKQKELLLKDGDKNTFESLFKSHYKALFNYAIQFVKDSSIAEGIVSNVFMTLWEKREHININTSLQAYLFRSIYNQCMNHIKHNEVKDKYKDYFIHHYSPTYSSGNDYPLSKLIESELQGKLNEVIENLPENCRKIFILSRYEELSNSEIAEKLEISVNTVKTQLYRALKKVKFELEDYLVVLLISLFL